jgi:hypothetical protein
VLKEGLAIRELSYNWECQGTRKKEISCVTEGVTEVEK